MNDASLSGTFTIGGDLTVNRLGYGAMQITGEGVWGPPRDHDEAIRVLRRAVELGVNFIDTADAYGPYVSEELIHEALHPYEGVVVATKAGLVRTGPAEWHPVGRPAYLRQEVEMSLRRLGVERIGLHQLHRIDPEVPLADQVGELAKLREEGKIRHIGLSQVSVDELEAAREVTEIATVQNLYNLADRTYEDLLDHCAAEGIGFIPWFPLATGALAGADSPVAELAGSKGVSPSQLALAWLLHRSPAMLPIPGTSSVAHLEDNIAAAAVDLTDEEIIELNAAAR